MKTISKSVMAVITALAIIAASHQSAYAGDREWATAGKVLTGVVAGAVLLKAFEPAPVYYQSTTYYSPPVVQVVAPPAVYIQPARVVMSPPPVLVQPAPIYVPAVPVYVAPRPTVSFHFGFGGHHHHHAPPVFRVCR